MELAAQKTSLIYRPQGMILTVIAIVTLWWLFQGNPTILALFAIIGFLHYGLKKPVWALANLIL